MCLTIPTRYLGLTIDKCYYRSNNQVTLSDVIHSWLSIITKECVTHALTYTLIYNDDEKEDSTTTKSQGNRKYQLLRWPVVQLYRNILIVAHSGIMIERPGEAELIER